MQNTYRVRCTPAARVVMGLQKQSIIEDAVSKVKTIDIQNETVVILQVNDMPLRIVVQAADKIIDVVTKEEADQSGLSTLK